MLGPSPRDIAFGSLKVSAPIARALDDMGYASPTPIQEQVIEPLLNGSDIVGQAQTGTGKTAGFGIPIAEIVDSAQRPRAGNRPDADARVGAAGYGRGELSL